MTEMEGVIKRSGRDLVVEADGGVWRVPKRAGLPGAKVRFALENNQVVWVEGVVAPNANEEDYQATDRALALFAGNTYRAFHRGHPGRKITDFHPDIKVSAQKLSIDRNAYNFVETAGDKPWIEKPVESHHAGHDVWRCDLLHGRIELTMTAMTPVFVPGGFPYKAEKKTPEEIPPANQSNTKEETDEDKLRKRLRHFFRLQPGTKEKYAIPGSSLKGALRSMVEAVTNDRFGVYDKDAHGRRHPFRRRGKHPGWMVRTERGYEITKASVVPCEEGTEKCVPYRRNLAALELAKVTHVLVSPEGKPFEVPEQVVTTYREGLKHPHYERHWSKHNKVYSQSDKKITAVREGLNELDGVLVYFTFDPKTRQVDSLGKNFNYLWPALTSQHELTKKFHPPDDRSLETELGLAELMFGFDADHKDADREKKKAHPFRGKVRVGTLWGPEADSFDDEKDKWPRLTKDNLGAPIGDTKGFVVRLAPLVSPESKAKARPLYLKGDEKIDPPRSASYSDQPPPEPRGRKFYWRQNVAEAVWPWHLYDELHADDQCPAPIAALNKDTVFKGEIVFENLSHAELGALLFVLEGAGDGRHTIQLGKGKPRGLGTFKAGKKVYLEKPCERYASLLAKPQVSQVADEALEPYRKAFQAWCEKQSGKAFAELGHIEDYLNLHRFPSGLSTRFYPVNWSDYSWLPANGVNPDEPIGNKTKRPAAMQAARNLEP